MQTKIQSTWQLINMESKQNLLEIRKKTVAGVTKNVRQIYQKYSSSGRKAETDEVENEIVD